MIRWTGPIFWRTEQEKFRIYYYFWYDEGFLNAKARVFCHEVSNDGDEHLKGEIVIYLHRYRWAHLRGLTLVEAERQLLQVVTNGNSDVAQCFLDKAEEDLEDFVNECRESPKYVIRPIVF